MLLLLLLLLLLLAVVVVVVVFFPFSLRKTDVLSDPETSECLGFPGSLGSSHSFETMG